MKCNLKHADNISSLFATFSNQTALGTLSFDSIPWQRGLLIVGILSLNGGSPRTPNVIYKLQSGLATQPSPAPPSRVRATLMELKMKLHTAKVICLKLLRKLEKALQNDILRSF